MANSPANTASESGRSPDFEPLRNANVQNGTAAMVRAANGKSRQRASNIRLSAVCAAMTVVTTSVMPSMLAMKNGVRPLDGPNTSRNDGSPRPDIKA